MMDLDRYLERIGFGDAPRVDEQTLQALHEAHLRTIPYENLDIQLGRRKLLDEERFAERIVEDRRGGWCYEMNGLFSRALREIGFRVDRVAGAAARSVIGDEAIGNHMVLIVHLDRPFVADVGLGDGPFHPFPLEERTWTENGFAFALAREADGWWRFTNHEHGLAPSFDFREAPVDLVWYQSQSDLLQDGEDSVFRQLAMTFRRDEGRIRALRELTYLEIEGPKRQERRIESFDDYSAVLLPLIDFELGDDLRRLWEHVHERVTRRAAAAAELEEREA